MPHPNFDVGEFSDPELGLSPVGLDSPQEPLVDAENFDLDSILAEFDRAQEEDEAEEAAAEEAFENSPEGKKARRRALAGNVVSSISDALIVFSSQDPGETAVRMLNSRRNRVQAMAARREENERLEEDQRFRRRGALEVTLLEHHLEGKTTEAAAATAVADREDRQLELREEKIQDRTFTASLSSEAISAELGIQSLREDGMNARAAAQNIAMLQAKGLDVGVAEMNIATQSADKFLSRLLEHAVPGTEDEIFQSAADIRDFWLKDDMDKAPVKLQNLFTFLEEKADEADLSRVKDEKIRRQAQALELIKGRIIDPSGPPTAIGGLITDPAIEEEKRSVGIAPPLPPGTSAPVVEEGPSEGRSLRDFLFSPSGTRTRGDASPEVEAAALEEAAPEVLQGGPVAPDPTSTESLASQVSPDGTETPTYDALASTNPEVFAQLGALGVLSNPQLKLAIDLFLQNADDAEVAPQQILELMQDANAEDVEQILMATVLSLRNSRPVQ